MKIIEYIGVGILCVLSIAWLAVLGVFVLVTKVLFFTLPDREP